MAKFDHDTDLYISQLDVDINWYKIFGKADASTASTAPSTPFATNIETAKKYGTKLVELAKEKGGITSSLESDKTSYPVLGFIIFTVKFIEKPKIKIINEISRDEINKMIETGSSEFDITSYVPNFSGERRYVLHGSAYGKLRLVSIYFMKIFDCDEHIAFSLYNSFGRLKLGDIQLLKVLLSNGNGMSFSRPNVT